MTRYKSTSFAPARFVPVGMGALPSLPPITSLISNVTLRSQVTPEYIWSPSREQKPQGGLTSLIMGFIKPAIYVKTPGGLVTMEPYGVPNKNYFPLIAFGTVLLGVGVVWGLVSIGKKLANKA